MLTRSVSLKHVFAAISESRDTARRARPVNYWLRTGIARALVNTGFSTSTAS